MVKLQVVNLAKKEKLSNKLTKGLVGLLTRDYMLSEDDAKTLIYNSNFYRLLKDDPKLVMHYSLEDWAEDILDESEASMLLM